MKRLTILISLIGTSAYGAEMPLNQDVTQETIQSTICVPGYTKSIRPPVSYTNPIKKQKLIDMGLPLELIGNFQLDHKIPLSLGGAAYDERNLELQDNDDAHRKDDIERCLPKLVCAGSITLNNARSIMWGDWRKGYEFCNK